MQAVGSSRGTWRDWLPAQHGAWVLLGIGAALGFIAAGGITPLAALCAGTMALGYVAVHVAASGHWRDVPAPLRWCVPVALLSAAAVVGTYAPEVAIPAALAAGAGWASTLALLRGGPTDPQAMVAGGLAAGASAATVAAAGGAALPVAAWLGAVVGLFALGRLSAVRVTFTRWNDAGPVIATALLPLLAVSLLAWWRGLGWWAPIAFVPATLLGLWLATSECRPTSRKCGLTEFTGALAFLLLAGIDVVP